MGVGMGHGGQIKRKGKREGSEKLSQSFVKLGPKEGGGWGGRGATRKNTRIISHVFARNVLLFLIAFSPPSHTCARKK